MSDVEVLAKVIDSLLEQNRYLTDKLIGDVIKEVPMENIGSMPIPMEYIKPYYGEEEEDLRALHDAGTIDASQLEDALKSAEFLSTEIELA